MAGVARVPTGHELRWDHADLAVGVDEVWPDDQLLRLHVDHPVRGRPTDALGADDLLEVGGDFVEFVARTVRQVRAIGDDPEAVRPGDDGAGAALAFIVEVGEVRVDAAPLFRRRFGGEQGEREAEERSEGGQQAHAGTFGRRWAKASPPFSFNRRTGRTRASPAPAGRPAVGGRFSFRLGRGSTPRAAPRRPARRRRVGRYP